MALGDTDYCLLGCDAVQSSSPTTTVQAYAVPIATLAHFHLLDQIQRRAQIANPLQTLRFSQR